MPLLNWVNDTRARSAASEVPFHLLKKISSYGDESEAKENLLIQGDNLLALKALLPFYRGKVKCIYIDPPYNTGSAFEHYYDHLEHSQWLSLMTPRLSLLREFLSEDGAIWVSIDDDEQAYLKVLMDEIFGRNNFINSIIWEKKFSPSNDARWFSDSHDFILCYAKNKLNWKPNLLPRDERMDSRYTNPDNDPRGVWTSGDLSVRTYNPNDDYPITTPSGRVINPPKGRCWGTSKENFLQLVADNRIWFGNKGNNVPRIKRFLSEVKEGKTPTTIWFSDEVGHNQEAKKEVKIFNDRDVFATPKPERLIKRIIELSTQSEDLVFDAFLGSGTTAAVAQKMGRRFIGIEIGDHAKTHCIPRLQKVVEGEQGGISKTVGWSGGSGFTFYELGPTVFDQFGSINPSVEFETLAAYIWQKETNTVTVPSKSPYLGTSNYVSIFLLYNGVLGDKRPEAGNVLTPKILRRLENEFPLEGQKIIYGEAVIGLTESELSKKGITFKQIPYDVTE